MTQYKAPRYVVSPTPLLPQHPIHATLSSRTVVTRVNAFTHKKLVEYRTPPPPPPPPSPLFFFFLAHYSNILLPVLLFQVHFPLGTHKMKCGSQFILRLELAQHWLSFTWNVCTFVQLKSELFHPHTSFAQLDQSHCCHSEWLKLWSNTTVKASPMHFQLQNASLARNISVHRCSLQAEK